MAQHDLRQKPAAPGEHSKSVTILETKDQTPTIRSIRVTKPAGFSFQVSQAMKLTLDVEEGRDWHILSIASSQTRDYLEFAIRNSESPFKRAFYLLKPGDEIRVSGPIGHFSLESDRPGIFITGGIGITPFKSIIEYATDSGLPTPLTLVYGNRSPDEVAYKEQLDELAQTNGNLRIVYTVSQPSPELTWDHRVGRIDGDLLDEVVAGGGDAIYYLAGPPSLVFELGEMVAAIGVPPERIRSELFRGYS